MQFFLKAQTPVDKHLYKAIQIPIIIYHTVAQAMAQDIHQMYKRIMN
jgi:hypothetical protein